MSYMRVADTYVGQDGDRDRLPHLTLCPTGPLTQLPLHAAGIYDDDSGPRIHNSVVSSYSSSLSPLTRSVEALTQQRKTPGVLVVTQPNTPGLPPLPSTTPEGARLQRGYVRSSPPHRRLPRLSMVMKRRQMRSSSRSKNTPGYISRAMAVKRSMILCRAPS